MAQILTAIPQGDRVNIDSKLAPRMLGLVLDDKQLTITDNALNRYNFSSDERIAESTNNYAAGVGVQWNGSADNVRDALNELESLVGTTTSSERVRIALVAEMLATSPYVSGSIGLALKLSPAVTPDAMVGNWGNSFAIPYAAVTIPETGVYMLTGYEYGATASLATSGTPLELSSGLTYKINGGAPVTIFYDERRVYSDSERVGGSGATFVRFNAGDLVTFQSIAGYYDSGGIPRQATWHSYSTARVEITRMDTNFTFTGGTISEGTNKFTYAWVDSLVAPPSILTGTATYFGGSLYISHTNANGFGMAGLLSQLDIGSQISFSQENALDVWTITSTPTTIPTGYVIPVSGDYFQTTPIQAGAVGFNYDLGNASGGAVNAVQYVNTWLELITALESPDVNDIFCNQEIFTDTATINLGAMKRVYGAPISSSTSKTITINAGLVFFYNTFFQITSDTYNGNGAIYVREVSSTGGVYSGGSVFTYEKLNGTLSGSTQSYWDNTYDYAAYSSNPHLGTGVKANIVVTTNPTSIDVGAGSGIIYGSPNWNEITWGATNLAVPVATNYAHYLVVNTSGTLSLIDAINPYPDRTLYITLGLVNHISQTAVDGFQSYGTTLKNVYNYTNDLWGALGVVKTGLGKDTATGVTFGLRSGVLSYTGVNSASDNYNNTKSYAAVGTASFRYITQTGVLSAPTTAISGANYDLGGTITAVPLPNGNATNLRLYMGLSGALYILYGQQVYASLTAAAVALPTATFITPPQFGQIPSVLLGAWSVVRSVTDLNNPAQALFTPSTKLGEITSSGGGSTLPVSTLSQIQTFDYGSANVISISTPASWKLYAYRDFMPSGGTFSQIRVISPTGLGGSGSGVRFFVGITTASAGGNFTSSVLTETANYTLNTTGNVNIPLTAPITLLSGQEYCIMARIDKAGSGNMLGIVPSSGQSGGNYIVMGENSSGTDPIIGGTKQFFSGTLAMMPWVRLFA